MSKGEKLSPKSLDRKNLYEISSRGDAREESYYSALEALPPHLPQPPLTNFFEFRLYRDGELVDRVQIGRPAILHKVKAIPPAENEEQFFKLLERYFSFSLPKVHDARSLAVELAKRTRFLKEEVVAEELKNVGAGLAPAQSGRPQGSPLHGFYEAFHKYLISGLSHDEFADLYSQTVTYGLFAARTRAENNRGRVHI